jgi:hypothetical protein
MPDLQIGHSTAEPRLFLKQNKKAEINLWIKAQIYIKNADYKVWWTPFLLQKDADKLNIYLKFYYTHVACAF